MNQTLGRRLGGVLGGTRNVATGQLASIQPVGGLIQGLRNVLSGHLKRMRAKCRDQGRKNVETGLLAKLRTPEHQAKAGRLGGRVGGRINGPKNIGFAMAALTPEIRAKAARSSEHVRWHVNRGIVKPGCTFCKEVK